MGLVRMKTSDAVRLAGLFAAVAGAMTVTTQAQADEPRKVTEPYVLGEPAEITQVVDALDEGDPFDLHLTLGYEQTWYSANIRRETFVAQPGLTTGGFISDRMNVASYTQTTGRLNVRADVGIFKDIALILRLPVILADDRKLDGLDGSDRQQTTVLAGAPGEQLFSLPFKSPTRSGIEYLAVGLDFGIFNQYRDRSKPTWVLGVEGRFNVAEPMHACAPSTAGLNQPGPQQKCAELSDVNRNGRSDQITAPSGTGGGDIPLEGNFSGGRQPGVSRGTTGLEGHTYLSKRIKYIEPYGGFRALFEFPTASSDYGQSDFKGALVNHPPLRGTMILGMAVYPWEERERFQRLAFDFRFTGTYVSEGRDYSELFDALGSSDAPSLRNAQFAEFRRNPNVLDPAICGNPPDYSRPGCSPSVVNENSNKVYFTGLTDVQQHGVYNFSTSVTWQAGEYVKFNFGGGYTLVQGHYITFDQPCNPDFDNDPNKAGPCRTSTGAVSGSVGGIKATGIPNPNYRASVNAPGHRFRVEDAGGVNAWINATVMF